MSKLPKNKSTFYCFIFFLILKKYPKNFFDSKFAYFYLNVAPGISLKIIDEHKNVR